MKIGMFDSGIGGLTVLKEFISKYPKNEYIYYGDTINMPFGDKTVSELINISKNIINFFIQKNVDLIIIACGTVSSNCYKILKDMTTIPIYDIISPTINYINDLNKDNVSVFGTKRTIESHVFKDRIKKEIIEIATPEFVPMIESNKINKEIIKKYCSMIKDSKNLILGCTHYPTIIDYIKEYLPNTNIINMASMLINNINITNDSDYKLTMYFSKIDNDTVDNINKIIKTKYQLNKISI